MSITRLIQNGLIALAGKLPAAAATGGVQWLGGPEGEGIVAQGHGALFERSYAGQLFTISTANAGVAIPTIASNMVGTYSILNPSGSGVKLELLRIRIALATTATAVIGSLQLAYQAAPAALSTPTLLVPQSTVLGSGIADASTIGYAAGTYTGTPVLYRSLGVSFGTVTENAGPDVIDLNVDGEVIIPPNTVIALTSSVAQTASFDISFTYARVPV